MWLYTLHNMCNYPHNHGHYGLLFLCWSAYEYWFILRITAGLTSIRQVAALFSPTRITQIK